MDVATLCVALLIGTRARAALPVTHEVANEAAAALALLSPFFDTQNVTLALYGNASWTGDFLSGLPPRTVRVVLPDADQYWEQEWISPTDNILVMYVGEGDVDPWRLMIREHGDFIDRTLYWFAVQDESVLFTMPGRVGPLIMTRRDVGVAVTPPNGSTGLYYIDTSSKCLTNNRASGAFKLADRWLPTEQRWQHGGSIFKVITSFCRGWRPAVPPEPMQFFHMPFRGKSWESEVFEMVWRRVRNELWKTTITTVKVTHGAIHKSVRYFLKKKIRTCRLDAFFWNVGGLFRFDPKEIEMITEKKMYPIVVVVPAGLGAVVSPLSSVTLEFSPAVWLGTALAALGTAAALACTLRRDRGAALLLALAPLLAQPPPPPPPPPAAGPALRPLLAVWLLVCVVLAAAYQGLLLGMLSSARPRGEIDSLEELAESGLRVDVSAQIPNLDRIYGKNISKILNGDIIATSSRMLHDIATHRNCALITIDDRFLARTIRRWNIPQKRLHRFSLGHNTLKLVAMWSPGSPLGALLASAYQRLDEAGVLDVWDNLVDDRDRHSLRSGFQHTSALTLKNMQPAFLLLLVGYALASVVLVAELLAARWPRDGAGPVRSAPAPTNLEVRLILVRPCSVARRFASFSCTSQM
ncbi:Dihydroorotase [Frankliniella fusca]|uniref:Dihydroorotase n=1 Tax=Frankliniella fusca TaxID=407009 RepID=A0AAE1HN67_9NEOP|nr:Dihydroorotase [Frankliniella fusca]